MAHWWRWHGSLKGMVWLIEGDGMAHWWGWHGSLMRMAWLIDGDGMAHCHWWRRQSSEEGSWCDSLKATPSFTVTKHPRFEVDLHLIDLRLFIVYILSRSDPAEDFGWCEQAALSSTGQTLTQTIQCKQVRDVLPGQVPPQVQALHHRNKGGTL